jgi:hypothetical protein
MDHGHNHGGPWAGTPTFAEQKGKYPFVAKHLDIVTFPHEHGRGRPVGPETDPHSVLGFTKWLIEEIKGSGERRR